MERVRAITRTAQDDGNLEPPAGNGNGNGNGRYGSPDLVDPHTSMTRMRTSSAVR